MSTHVPPPLPESGTTREMVSFRFNDIDVFGHLNNAVYLELLDLGKVVYFLDANGGRFSAGNIAFVIVHIDINYYHPTYATEHIDVVTHLDKLGEKSAVFEQWVVGRESDEIKCHARTVMAHMNKDFNQAVPISDEYREHILNTVKRLTSGKGKYLFE